METMVHYSEIQLTRGGRSTFERKGSRFAADAETAKKREKNRGHHDGFNGSFKHQCHIGHDPSHSAACARGGVGLHPCRHQRQHPSRLPIRYPTLLKDGEGAAHHKRTHRSLPQCLCAGLQSPHLGTAHHGPASMASTPRSSRFHPIPSG